PSPIPSRDTERAWGCSRLPGNTPSPASRRHVAWRCISAVPLARASSRSSRADETCGRRARPSHWHLSFRRTATCAAQATTTDLNRSTTTTEMMTMLTNPTIETLKALKLYGMLEALEEQQQTPATVQSLSFEERFALLIDRERLCRDNQRRTRLLRGARLKVAEASIEDINYKAARGLDKRQIAQLATGEWIRRTQNLLITGATGSGKTWIACALSQQTCRQGQSVLYFRMPRLIEELRIAHGDGS